MTSTARITFLNSLCTLPRFRALVDLVQLVVRRMFFLCLHKIYLNYLHFSCTLHLYRASTRHGLHGRAKRYLPAEFHLASAFKKALSIGSKALEKCVLSEDGRIDAPLLLLGLMYWEASRVMEIEPGAAADIPVHLSESPFGIKELNKIKSMIGKVCLLSS